MKPKSKSKSNYWIILPVLILGLLTLIGCSAFTQNAGYADVLQEDSGNVGNNRANEQQVAVASTSMAMAQSQASVSRNAQAANLALADVGTGGANAPAPVDGVVVQQEPLVYALDAEEAEVEADFDNGDDEELLEESAEAMFFENYGVNPFVEASEDNLSTFAMDVDTASFTLARSYLLDYNQLPPAEAIRAEEFINYFPTDYAQPAGDEAFAIHVDAAPSTYSGENQVLMRVGLQGRTIAAADRDPALLVFVVDVSGSMNQSNRLELAKQALNILVGELREDDRVGIVIYADNTRVVLEPTPASEQHRITSAINSLQTEGSTYAEAGLRLGYEMALTQRQEGENARVILISDGVANVGETGPEAILNTIRQGVDSGVTLSSIGVGMGNFNDVLLERLANDGNGNYFYVDNLREARRVFVNNLTSTLQVIAYDAKIQVEFNRDAVTRYRLIGYENRDIADADFRNDAVDAGEVGAGHTVTAIYEVELNPQAQSGATMATAYIRYQDADTREVIEVNQPFTLADSYDDFDSAPDSFRMLVAITEFSELLRHSPFAEDSSYDAVVAVLETLSQNNPDVGELIQMVVSAGNLSGQQ